MPCPGCFTLGTVTQYQLYRKLSGPQGRYGLIQKLLPPPGFERVAGHYTDYAVAAPYM